MRGYTLLLPIGAALVLSGCHNATGNYVPKPVAPVVETAPKEGLDQNYVPIEVGKQWTYTSESTRLANGRRTTPPDVEYIYKITKVDKGPSGQVVNWDIKAGDKLVDQQTWIINDKGIFQSVVGLQHKQFTTPQPLILFPVDSNKDFTWKGSGQLPNGTLGSNVVKSQVMGMQEVDTDMGRVKAISIESELDFATSTGRGKGKSVIWLSPGLGIVRFAQTVGQGNVLVSETLRLKSHS